MTQDGKRKLEEILQREEYQQYYEENMSFWMRIKNLILEYLEKFIVTLFPQLETSANIAEIIMMIIIIFVVLLLVVMFFRIFHKRMTEKVYERTVPLDQFYEKNWTYKDHFNRAKKEEGKEDYQEAIRHLFLGLLLYYDSIDWLQAKIWKTNWEYYAELRKRSRKEAKIFDQLASIFDEVTYGEKEVSPWEYEEYKVLIDGAYNRAKQIEEDEGRQ